LRMRLWRRVQLRSEPGMALVMALGMTVVLGIAGTTAMVYSNSDAKQAIQTGSRQSAFALAEAGINNTMAILDLPTNNALDPDVLPKCTTNGTKYTDPTASRTSTTTWLHSTLGGGGTVDYCGTLIRSSAIWYLTSIGNTRNPNNANAKVTRTLEATVTVTPTISQPLNNPVWNYLQRQPRRSRRRAAGCRLRHLVRERDPGTLSVVHELERDAADLRRQLPES